MARMGKWFDGYDTQFELRKAKQWALAKGFQIWKVTYRNPTTIVFYVGDQVPKKIIENLNKGRVRVEKLDF